MGVNNYAWGVELKPTDGGGSISLRISDAALDLPGVQYDPGIPRWNRVPLGGASLVNNRYFVPSYALELLVRNYAPQDPDDNLITLFQTHDFLQAEVFLYQQDFGAEYLPENLVFLGVVTAVGRITREAVQLTITAEDSTSVRPGLQLTRALYPKIRQVDDNQVAPVVIGDASWRAKTLLRDMGPTVANLDLTQDWRWFMPTRGMSPAYVIDTDDTAGYLVRGNSIDGGSQDTGQPGPPNAALWPDEPRSPVEFLKASWASGVVTIPRELAVNYPASSNPVSGPPLGGPQDGQIRVSRCHVPNDVTDATINAWTNPQNALDRTDMSSYAEVGKGTSSWQSWYTSEGRFVRYPSRPYLTIRNSDGAAPQLVALVYGVSNTNTNLIWELEMTVRGQTQVNVTRDLSAQAGGWAIISWNILDSWVNGIAIIDDFIYFQGTALANRQWWGENSDPANGNAYDHIAVRSTNATAAAAVRPRVAMLGVLFEHLVDPGPLIALSKGGYLRGIEKEGDQARPATVLMSTANAGPPYTPSTIVTSALLQYTANAKRPIQSGDLASSGVGDFFAYNTLMNNNVSGATGGVETSFLISGVQESDVPFRETLTVLMRSLFSDIWYSPRRQLYGIKAFQPGQAVDGATLYEGDLWDDPIEALPLALDDVYNAIYLTCWNDSRTVSIDSTNFQSRIWDGSRNTALEAQADASQGRWGRRVLRRSLQFIQDPTAAYEVLVRMWTMLREPRQEMLFRVSPEWGLAREQSEVFTTDASLDRIMPVPIKGQTSWGGLTWQITSVQVEPRGGCVVLARWNDLFP